MLSVGNRNGREGLGFGRDMEDTELEEGEACSYQDDDLTVDPDIALAYLDEKLHSVLGHFQKDFEGGVSAENLGAKFGGYGSFLPTYQRSPVCSHPRTLKVQNHALRSPSNSQLEGGFHNITMPASDPLPIHCPDIDNSRTLSSTKPLSTHDPVKLDAGMAYRQAEELTHRAEASKKSTLSDQKKLKVRIRVGSDNLSTRTKAELYSGLGLDASPSSSFEDSPESEGWSREPHDPPVESPNSILHIMTSCPLQGSNLLSPLAENLAYLRGNKKNQKGWRSDSAPKSETGKSLSLANGPGPARNNGKLLVPKNKKMSRINGMSLELSNSGTKDVHDVISKSEKTDDDASACEKLISEALKLPLLSAQDCTGSEFPKNNGEVSEVFGGVNKVVISLESGKVESSDLYVNHDDVWFDEKPTAEVGSAGNISEDQKENFVGDTDAQSRKYLIRKGGKNYGSPGTELNPSKVLKNVRQEIITYPTLKTDFKAVFQEPDVRSVCAVKDQNSSKAKSKSDMTPGHINAAEVAKGKARVGYSCHSKLENSLNQPSKYDAENTKLQNGVRKCRDTYKNVFGDFNVDSEENVVEPLEYPSGRCPKGPQVTDVSKVSLNSAMMEKTSRKVENSMTSESHSKSGSHVIPPASGHVPDSPAPPAPVLIEEHWVCCDKCQKWRLLPLGRLPESLPEKWLCSMLDWLPGMNRCDIEEEETTKALVSFYQASVPESDKNYPGHNGGSTSGALPACIQQPSFTFNSVASIAKTKIGSTVMSIAVRSHGQADVGDWTKILQPTVKSRCLNHVNQSLSLTELDNQLLKKSSDSVVEKKKKVSKDKQKLNDHSSDGGNMENVKTNKKRGAGQDSPRASKKHKNVDQTDDSLLSDTDHRVHSQNGGPNTSSIFQAVVAGKDRTKSTEAIHYTNHTGENLDNSQTSSKKSKDRDRHAVDVSVEKRRGEPKDPSAKKRKTKGSQESRQSESMPSAGLKTEEKKESLKDNCSQGHLSEEKKAKLASQETRLFGSKRESLAARGDLAVQKDLKLAQDPDSISAKRSVEDRDLSRRDLASTHLFTEATSSSSKISSSRKSKANNLQDTKGSPVESVSSSPLRSQSKDRATSNGRIVCDKECPSDGFGLSGSPKRYSDHDFDSRSGAMGQVKKDNGQMEKTYFDDHKGTKISSALVLRDSVSDSKSKGKPTACEELPGIYSVDGVANSSDQYPCEQQASDCVQHEEACGTSHNLLNGSLSVKRGSSMRSKDSMRKPEFGSDKTNVSNFSDNSQDRHAYGENSMDENLAERTAAKCYKLEKKNDKKVSSENSKKCTQVKSGSDDGQDAKPDIFSCLSSREQTLVEEYKGTSITLPPEKIDLLETSLLRGKSALRSPLVGGSLTDNCRTCNTSGPDIGNEINYSNVDAYERDNSLKGPKPFRKADDQNGAQPATLRHPTPTGHKARDLNGPSPARRDSSSQSAANAVKEAKSLKHMADRVKSSGSNAESIGLYFQAALKFLLGASLLESSTNETRHGEMIQSTQMYSSTAKLCEFCAYEYEKAKDMASAALAYKCTEVAYMRVIYSSHSNANRDRHELQTALQMAPPGESPSSSASDVDNLNNAATGDKVLLTKGMTSPQVAGSHVISARNRPGFARLLNFAQDVNFAMEASRKSRAALAAANAHLELVQNEEGISSIKRALDFSFQDVEGLLRLVRLGMEAISR